MFEDDFCDDRYESDLDNWEEEMCFQDDIERDFDEEDEEDWNEGHDFDFTEDQHLDGLYEE